MVVNLRLWLGLGLETWAGDLLDNAVQHAQGTQTGTGGIRLGGVHEDVQFLLAAPLMLTVADAIIVKQVEKC